MGEPIRSLLVLYDSGCPFCVRCRTWLEKREPLVPLAFECCRSPEARRRYGHIENLGRDLVVVDERGRYWTGPAAFVMCFWALDAFRWVAEACASPLLWPVARAVFEEVSATRGPLGALTGTPCIGESCGLPPAASPYR